MLSTAFPLTRFVQQPQSHAADLAEHHHHYHRQQQQQHQQQQQQQQQPAGADGCRRAGSQSHDLDVTPSRLQALALERIAGGDRVVIARGGRGFCWERGDQSISADLVRQLLARQWVAEPAYPLFGDAHAGCMTHPRPGSAGSYPPTLMHLKETKSMAKTTRAASEPEAPPAPPIEPEATTGGNGVVPMTPEIPPPDAKAKVSKYARFTASEQVLAATTETSHTCAYGPPPKTAFVRAHPDKALRIPLLTVVHEVGTKKTSYLLDDALQADPDLEGMIKLVMVVPYVTHHQPPKLGVWPISIEHERNPWIQGALNIVDQITLKWLRVVPMTKRSEYLTKPAAVDFPEPEWSKLPSDIDGWLDMAFRPSDWITPENWADHSLRKALREG